MPIYEYRCTSCGHELDALQKVSDEPLTVCPACSESALVKKISAAGFRLKGGGWYETDFKSGKKRNVAGEAGTGSTSGEGAGKPAEGAGKPAEGAAKPAEGAAKPAEGGKTAKTSTPGSSSSSDAG